MQQAHDAATLNAAQERFAALVEKVEIGPDCAAIRRLTLLSTERGMAGDLAMVLPRGR